MIYIFIENFLVKIARENVIILQRWEKIDVALRVKMRPLSFDRAYAQATEIKQKLKDDHK
jgi:hypothetical protein